MASRRSSLDAAMRLPAGLERRSAGRGVVAEMASVFSTARAARSVQRATRTKEEGSRRAVRKSTVPTCVDRPYLKA